MNRNEIFTKVSHVLVDALGVNEEEVTPNATLRGDLRIESMDYLDVMFRLEKAFGIRLDRAELFPEYNPFFNSAFVQDGKLTAAGLADLQGKMPFVNFDEFAKDPDAYKIVDLLTVESICDYINTKM